MYMSSGFGSAFSVLIAIALTIAGIIFLYLKILPERFNGKFNNKVFQCIHDYFNFKKLYIESVLKFLFTLLTVVCIAVGISIMVSTFFGVFRSIGYIIDGMPFRYLFSSFFGGIFTGLLTIVVGPVALRLIYEGIMMFIILVKNVIDINNKIDNQGDSKGKYDTIENNDETEEKQE